MVEKYKFPVSKKNEISAAEKYEKFNIETVVKSLALNRHNDSTTTYYLLHKKWIQEVMSDKNGTNSGHLTVSTGLGNSSKTLVTSNASKSDLKFLRVK